MESPGATVQAGPPDGLHDHNEKQPVPSSLPTSHGGALNPAPHPPENRQPPPAQKAGPEPPGQPSDEKASPPHRSTDPDPGLDPDRDLEAAADTDSAHSTFTSHPPPPPLEADHISLGGDNPIQHTATSATSATAGAIEIPDEVYDRFPARRKQAMVALLAFCSFLSPVSSTSVLAATPEVAAEYGTDGTVINVVNAVYMLMMGISPVVWGPMSEVYGRRRVSFLFHYLPPFLSHPNSDVYRPTERATALGWFLSGTLIGPALGPFIGGIIVTYTSWRVIFWPQTGLSGLAALFTFTPLLPETIHHRKADDLDGYSPRQKAAILWRMVSPARVLLLFRYPNLIAASVASSAIIWNMYSLLTPIRYVLNPRFALTSPMQSGLFYLAPGCGYLLGTLFGGRYADHVVKTWIARRGGVRVPEDRLRSAVPFMGVVIPACVLVYGWCVDQEAGGIPMAVLPLFVQGVAQLFCFPSLNTYCLDVMQGRGAEVIAGNYFVRYLFACTATACVLPGVQGIGVGWFSTITALFLVVSTAVVQATVWWGKSWRDRVDGRRRAKRRAQQRLARKELGRRANEA